jgi:hypothetical protein
MLQKTQSVFSQPAFHKVGVCGIPYHGNVRYLGGGTGMLMLPNNKEIPWGLDYRIYKNEHGHTYLFQHPNAKEIVRDEEQLKKDAEEGWSWPNYILLSTIDKQYATTRTWLDTYWDYKPIFLGRNNWLYMDGSTPWAVGVTLAVTNYNSATMYLKLWGQMGRLSSDPDRFSPPSPIVLDEVSFTILDRRGNPPELWMIDIWGSQWRKITTLTGDYFTPAALSMTSEYSRTGNKAVVNVNCIGSPGPHSFPGFYIDEIDPDVEDPEICGSASRIYAFALTGGVCAGVSVELTGVGSLEPGKIGEGISGSLSLLGTTPNMITYSMTEDDGSESGTYLDDYRYMYVWPWAEYSGGSFESETYDTCDGQFHHVLGGEWNETIDDWKRLSGFCTKAKGASPTTELIAEDANTRTYGPLEKSHTETFTRTIDFTAIRGWTIDKDGFISPKSTKTYHHEFVDTYEVVSSGTTVFNKNTYTWSGNVTFEWTGSMTTSWSYSVTWAPKFSAGIESESGSSYWDVSKSGSAGDNNFSTVTLDDDDGINKHYYYGGVITILTNNVYLKDETIYSEDGDSTPEAPIIAEIGTSYFVSWHPVTKEFKANFTGNTWI